MQDGDEYYDWGVDDEFEGYVPSTIDPSPWMLLATLLICFFIIGIAVAFLFLRRRRRKQKAKKASQLARMALMEQKAKEQDESDSVGSIEISVVTSSHESFLKRRPLRVASRLKGWNDIADAFEEENSIEVKRAWARIPPIASTPLAEDVLDKDLFEAGGVLHQLDRKIRSGVCASQVIEEAVVHQKEEKVEGRGGGGGEAPTNPEDGTTASEVTADYQLMDPNEQKDQIPRKGFIAYILHLFQRDRETKKILKLAIPYSITGLIDSFSSLAILAVIGRQMGTRELSAYVMVAYLVQITTMFLDGIVTAITTVASQAIGSGNYALAGQYTQLALILYEILFFPQIILWWNYVGKVMLWMEFDEQEADIAQGYARVYLIGLMVQCVQHSFTNLLEVSGFEKFTTAADSSHALVVLLVIVGVIMHGRVPIYGTEVTLRTIGVAMIIVDVAFLLIKVAYMRTKERWWNRYWPGIVGTLSLTNYRAVKNFSKTAVPQAVGHVLSYGEWEILFIIASMMGPAEAAAWGILGEVWSALEELTYAWGDAAEVRCATLLGAGKAQAAKKSTHKSLAFGTSGAIFASLLLLACTKSLPGWITHDEVLKSMVKQLIPFISLGNITLTLGTLSWQLIGAQTRYSLATAVQFIGSWLVTLPLAVLSSFYFNWNLTSLVSSIVIGNMVSGMMNFIILCCTDWEVRAAKIMAKNALEEEEESSDEEDGLMVDDGVAMQRISPSPEDNGEGEIDEVVKQVKGNALGELNTEPDVKRARTVLPTVEVKLDNK